MGAFLTGAFALIFLPLAVIVGTPTEWLLRYITMIAERLSAHPFAATTVSISQQQLVVCYALLAMVIVYLQRRTKFEFRKSNIIE